MLCTAASDECRLDDRYSIGAVQCSPGHCPRHRLAYNDLLVYLILLMTYHLAPHSSRHCSQQKRISCYGVKNYSRRDVNYWFTTDDKCFTRIVSRKIKFEQQFHDLLFWTLSVTAKKQSITWPNSKESKTSNNAFFGLVLFSQYFFTTKAFPAWQRYFHTLFQHIVLSLENDQYKSTWSQSWLNQSLGESYIKANFVFATMSRDSLIVYVDLSRFNCFFQFLVCSWPHFHFTHHKKLAALGER